LDARNSQIRGKNRGKTRENDLRREIHKTEIGMERGGERERERGADVYNDKDVLVNSQRLSAKTTTADVSFLLFNSVRID